MKETPLIFLGAMIPLLLDDRKPQTRRKNGLKEINEEPHMWHYRGLVNPLEDGLHHLFGYADGISGGVIKCPFGKPGDRIWVRETFQSYCKLNNKKYPHKRPSQLASDGIIYKADGSKPVGPWNPLSHMPRWASRIVLEITDIRVERVQDISKTNVIAEGILKREDCPIEDCYAGWHEPFAILWDSIYGEGAWEKNEWVWAISFKSKPHLSYVRLHA